MKICFSVLKNPPITKQISNKIKELTRENITERFLDRNMDSIGLSSKNRST